MANYRSNSVRGRICQMQIGEILEIPRTECAEMTVRTTVSNLKPYNGQTYTVNRTEAGVAVKRLS
jgi:hypothetical protein